MATYSSAVDLDIGYLFSQPLVALNAAASGGTAGAVQEGAEWEKASVPTPLEILDIDTELAEVTGALRDSKRQLRFKSCAATFESFRDMVSVGVTVLHISGHGKKGYLAFEDESGAADLKDAAALEDIFRAGGTICGEGGVQLVFVATCHSQDVGEMFAKVGVPHVVAIKSDEVVADRAALTFARHFYLELIVGKTVRQAFDVAKRMVKHKHANRESNMELEQHKFLLLGKDGDGSSVDCAGAGAGAGAADGSAKDDPHDVVIFPKSSSFKSGLMLDRSTPEGQYFGQRVSVSRFVGRVREIRDIFLKLKRETGGEGTASCQHVAVVGPHGIGKTFLVQRACMYMAQRRMFDKIYMIDVQSEAGTLLRSWSEAQQVARRTGRSLSYSEAVQPLTQHIAETMCLDDTHVRAWNEKKLLRGLQDTVAALGHGRRMLLVLDGVEDMIIAMPHLFLRLMQQIDGVINDIKVVLTSVVSPTGMRKENGQKVFWPVVQVGPQSPLEIANIIVKVGKEHRGKDLDCAYDLLDDNCLESRLGELAVTDPNLNRCVEYFASTAIVKACAGYPRAAVDWLELLKPGQVAEAPKKAASAGAGGADEEGDVEGGLGSKQARTAVCARIAKCVGALRQQNLRKQEAFEMTKAEQVRAWQARQGRRMLHGGGGGVGGGGEQIAHVSSEHHTAHPNGGGAADLPSRMNVSAPGMGMGMGVGRRSFSGDSVGDNSAGPPVPPMPPAGTLQAFASPSFARVESNWTLPRNPSSSSMHSMSGGGGSGSIGPGPGPGTASSSDGSGVSGLAPAAASSATPGQAAQGMLPPRRDEVDDAALVHNMEALRPPSSQTAGAAGTRQRPGRQRQQSLSPPQPDLAYRTEFNRVHPLFADLARQWAERQRVGKQTWAAALGSAWDPSSGAATVMRLVRSSAQLGADAWARLAVKSQRGVVGIGGGIVMPTREEVAEALCGSFNEYYGLRAPPLGYDRVLEARELDGLWSGRHKTITQLFHVPTPQNGQTQAQAQAQAQVQVPRVRSLEAFAWFWADFFFHWMACMASVLHLWRRGAQNAGRGVYCLWGFATQEFINDVLPVQRSPWRPRGEGTFLVRMSATQPNTLVICCLTGDNVTNNAAMLRAGGGGGRGRGMGGHGHVQQKQIWAYTKCQVFMPPSLPPTDTARVPEGFKFRALSGTKFQFFETFEDIVKIFPLLQQLLTYVHPSQPQSPNPGGHLHHVGGGGTAGGWAVVPQHEWFRRELAPVVQAQQAQARRTGHSPRGGGGGGGMGVGVGVGVGMRSQQPSPSPMPAPGAGAAHFAAAMQHGGTQPQPQPLRHSPPPHHNNPSPHVQPHQQQQQRWQQQPPLHGAGSRRMSAAPSSGQQGGGGVSRGHFF